MFLQSPIDDWLNRRTDDRVEWHDDVDSKVFIRNSVDEEPFKNGPNPAILAFLKMGQTRPLCLFSFFSHEKYSTNDKSVDCVLGTQTQRGRMVSADESTELWWNLSYEIAVKHLDKYYLLLLGDIRTKPLVELFQMYYIEPLFIEMLYIKCHLLENHLLFECL